MYGGEGRAGGKASKSIFVVIFQSHQMKVESYYKSCQPFLTAHFIAPCIAYSAVTVFIVFKQLCGAVFAK